MRQLIITSSFWKESDPLHSSRTTSQLIATCTTGFLLIFVLSFISEIGNTAFAAPHSSSILQHTTKNTAAASNTAVTTYKEDTEHTGNHTTETTLNTSNVNKNTFGKRVIYPTDGQLYTQPLFLPNVTIGGTPHNVVYVTTEHDSVYAFDADATTPVAPLWHVNFTNPPNVVPPSNTDLTCNDMVPEDGLSGTPVIDPTTGTLYVVMLTKENGSFVYRLHALDVTTGLEKPGSPIVIQASVPGTGAGSVNGTVTFNPQRQRQRSALVLANGKVYIAWGSFCDDNPYHGWIMSYTYDGSQFQQANVYNDTANASEGGIWGAGGAISADANGNIYYVSGNGIFDVNTGGADYGDSFVRLNAQLQVQDYFTPFNQQCLDSEDADLGSGGPLLLPGQNRIISAGKEGRIYVLDTTNMGKYNTIANPCSNQTLTNVDKIVQELPPSTIGGLYSNATYWQNASNQQYVYFAGANSSAKVFTLTNGKLSTSPSSQTPETFGFTGGNPTVSSNNGAAGTGIVWTLDPTPALRAFNATNLSKELYNSTQDATRDGLESYIKFSAPTVANGEVFVGTQSSLDIFGLLPSPTPTPTPGGPTPTPSPTPVPTAGYNNIAISDDHARASANYDIEGNSYSAEALANDGILPDGSISSNGFLFTWPNVASGSYDNYLVNGQQIAVSPVNNADHLAFLGSATNSASSGTVTINYTDGSTQLFTLSFTDWTAKTLSFGNNLVAVMPYRNTRSGTQSIPTYLYSASVALQTGKTIQSVTLPATTTGGQLHIFAITTSSLTKPIYNNIGITDDTINPGANQDNGNIAPGSFDKIGGTSYSAQALQTIGIIPGQTITAHGITFTWPDTVSNRPDNYLANGQQIAITPVAQADHLAFLGSAAYGPTSGTATITYTDGSTQSFTLGFTDWAAKTLSFGNTIVATIPYRNTSNGKQAIPISLYSASVALQTGKTIQRVTLPTTTTGGQLHVFAIATSSLTAPIYNNVGITNNGALGPGNFDGNGITYSAQAMQQAGLNAGDNAFDPTHTVVFTWPSVPAGTPENYQTTGQVIPITSAPGATVLGFLGSAAYGPSAGQATITYTDGTQTPFTLGVDDWTLNGGKTSKLSYGDVIAYTTLYRNNPHATKGAEAIKTYVFYNRVSIDPTKTVASVTLPASVNHGQLHVFAISTK